ncbi:MAG TPA: hypothetical protein VHB79_30095 [Polyangiaceae bacterium]|nr:hypothetical protein [Polyangiaceae bacterium]
MTGEPILQPLKQQQRISDPDLALGARLLVHAQPLPRSEIRKRRVWNMLASSPGSRFGLRLTAVHVAAASVLFAAVSSAAVGHYYREYRAAQVTETEAAPAEAALKARRAHAPAKPKPALVRALEPTSTPEEAAALPQSAAPTVHPQATRPKADASPSHKSDADAELLVEAMRARGAGDSARVSELVDQYRAKHPQGVLQEEALILSIESAAARHAPNTAALAREYLQRFPSGRFAAQARRASAADAR